MTQTATPESTEAPIVARAGRYYRNARYIMVLAILAFAAMFAYDGFVAWPAKNVKIDQVQEAWNAATTDEQKRDLDMQQRSLGTKKSETDIALQKKLAFILPVAAAGYLVFFLRKSRGEIRLENGTLYAPGHPPVPMSDVRSLDTAAWDKKGVARINYDASGSSRTLVLDDFVYQQKPIDAIFNAVAAYLKSKKTSDPAPAAETPTNLES